MITGYFGLPGCGKTTFLTMIAQKELKRIAHGKSVFKRVYTNYYCAGCYQINMADLSKYKIEDSLILLDEISIDADSRDFKNFSKGLRDFFILHRHLNCSICWFTQSYDKMDKTIRDLTFDLWYVTKSPVPILDRWSYARRIFRNININEYTSELTIGYRFCTFLESIFQSCTKFCYRPKWYSFFDSFETTKLDDRQPIQSSLW